MPITLKDDSNLEAQSAQPAPRSEVKQRRRMLLALAVLLAAVVILFIKDRQLWLSSGAVPESEITSQSAAPPPPGPVPSLPAAEVGAPAIVPRAVIKKRSAPRAPAADNTPPGPMITATDRAVLPPLEVEVVAGNQHQALAPSKGSVKVEMQPATPAGAGQATAPAPSQAGNSDAHVSLSQSAAARVTRTVEPGYPLLAKQMKVQGAVVLQALIDKTGNIEDLHVVSGPTILAAAAREAVKQWHFKPYYQGNQAVETEARITVNFTISTY
ncbi:MAG: TonB family protein [Terriglobales bacterium]|jgi:periplasmic protein TonB